MSKPTAAWARDEKDDGADHSDCPCRDLPVDFDELNYRVDEASKQWVRSERHNHARTARTAYPPLRHLFLLD